MEFFDGSSGWNLRKIRNLEILGALITMAAAVVLHFLYDWLPYPPVALISSINESVWEHTKIVTVPYLAFAVYEWFAFGKENPALFLKAKAIGLWSIPVFMISFYYTYTGIFGGRSSVVDITSAFVWSAVAFLISYTLLKRGKPAGNPRFWLTMILLLIFLQFFFTFSPPDLPLFRSAV